MRLKIARTLPIALVGIGAYLGVALLSSSPASAATSLCSDPVTERADRPCDGVGRMDAGLWQGAGHRFGALPGLFSVPAHLRPAARADRRAVRV